MPVPFISVVMPVYNMEKYVSEAIKSILHQTLTNFELIIIDDGSTDNSLKNILSHNDLRISLIINDTNEGNYPARNKAMRTALGKYICVMDADDIAMPDRLLTQYNFMEYHPEYVAVGTFVYDYLGNNVLSPFICNIDEDICKAVLLRDNVCIHPSLILRRTSLLQNDIFYNEEYYYAADYDLLVRLTEVGAICNIPSFLLQYRIHDGQISQKKRVEQTMYTDRIRLSQIYKFGITPTQEQSDIHLKIMKQQIKTDEEFSLAKRWTDLLLEQNTKLSAYNQNCLTNLFHSLLKKRN